MTTQSLLYNKNLEVSRGRIKNSPGSDRHPVNQGHGQVVLPPDLQSSLDEALGNLPVGVKGDSQNALSQVEKSGANSYLDKKARSDNLKTKSTPEAYSDKRKKVEKSQKTGVNCQNIGNFQKQEKSSQKTIKENQSEGLSYQKGVCEDVSRRDPSESYCGKYGKIGDGDGGDRYFKKIFCYKDWCSKCRKIGHGRRLARIMPKISVMETAGFWVVTTPREMRRFFEDKKNLSVARTFLRRKFERIYPGIQAIIAFHTHGDITEEDLEAEKVQVYKPHWNILVNGQGKIPNSVIEEVKRDWKRYLERATGISLGNKKVVVWYSFRDTKEKISHTARYITRPTFLIYEAILAQRLKGFIRMSVWGAKKFRVLSEEELMNEAIQREKYTKLPSAVVLLQNNISPKDGGRIYWRSGLYPGWLSEFGKMDLGFGYTDISNLSDDDITALEIRYKIEADKNGQAVFRKDIAWRATDEEKDRLARENGRDWWDND